MKKASPLHLIDRLQFPWLTIDHKLLNETSYPKPDPKKKI